MRRRAHGLTSAGLAGLYPPTDAFHSVPGHIYLLWLREVGPAQKRRLHIRIQVLRGPWLELSVCERVAATRVRAGCDAIGTPTWLSAIVLEWNARLSVNRLRLDARIVLIMESPRCRNTLAEITFIPIRDSILVLTVNWFLSVFGCYCYLPFESFKVVSSKHCSKYSIKLTYKVPIGL